MHKRPQAIQAAADRLQALSTTERERTGDIIALAKVALAAGFTARAEAYVREAQVHCAVALDADDRLRMLLS